MRDGAAAKDGPLAPSWANSASRRCVEGLRPPKAFSWRRYAIARVRNDRLISRDGAFPNMAFQRSRRSLVLAFDRPAISAVSATRFRTCARRFMIVSLGVSRPSTQRPSSYVVLLWARNLRQPMTHTLLDSRHGASRARWRITANVGSYKVSPSLRRFPIRVLIALIVQTSM